MRNKVTKAGADYMSIKDCEDTEPYDEKQGYLYCFSQEKGASPRTTNGSQKNKGVHFFYTVLVSEAKQSREVTLKNTYAF